MEGHDKDVVGARINLDTGKMLPAFKEIDAGAKKNSESFANLIGKIVEAEKEYDRLSKSMSKTVLSQEEQRKKVLDESAALVAQRKAAAELMNAKKQQLDTKNQLVDSKLQTQLAIQKKREQAIEQQEAEHQKRLTVLQNKVATASASENLVQAKIDRQFQIMKNGDMKLEMEADRHIAKLQEQAAKTASIDAKAQQQAEKHQANMLRLTAIDNSPSTISTLGSKVQDAALHATVFTGIYSAINVAQQALKEGLVDIESNMAGYVQTNEAYFVSFDKGTNKMVMDTQKLSDETTKFIHTAHDLGASITDVTESARLWGRMYKDVGVVQEMVRASTKLSTVDLVSLEDSTKSMEAVFSQYGVQVRNANDAMVFSNRVLDSWSEVAHDTMAPARDLGAAFERTGKIAAETGVSFDFMNGLISSGVRNTALSGENLGNMWKTVLGTIRTDKAVNEIESLGVATKEVVNGSEQWRKAEDILLDLSVKVIDKNYDLTKSYEDISRGVYQYAKLAASLNAGDILLGTAASIGSTGSTIEYLKVQMDTIQRKAVQTRTSLLEIFNKAGDDGLRSTIKDALDVLDKLLIGITKIPKGVFEASAGIAGLILLYQNVVKPLMMWKTAQESLAVAMRINTVVTNTETVAMVAQAAAARNAAAMTALATGGITLLTGALAALIISLGSSEKAHRDRIQAMKDEDSASQQLISQYQRQSELVPKLVSAHNQLQQSLNSGTLSSEKQVQVKKQLDEVSKALVITLGEEGAGQLKAAKYTDQAVQKQVEVLNKLIEKQNEARQNVLRDQENDLRNQQVKKQNELTKATEEYTLAQLAANGATADTSIGLTLLARLESSKKKVEELKKENNSLTQSLAELGVQVGELALDQLAGSAGKATESIQEQEEALEELKRQIESNSDAISEANNLLKDHADGQSLNAEVATELILKYPKLLDAIHKTSDGWAFEKDTLEQLRKEKIQKAIDDLKSEQSSLASTKLATTERLKAYGIEMNGIRDLAAYKTKMNEALDRKKSLESFADSPASSFIGGGFDPNQYLKDQAKKLAAEEGANLREIESVYDDYFTSMDDYQKKIDKLSDLYNDPNFGVSKGDKSSGGGSSKGNDPRSKAFQASQDYIEHRKKMGELTLEQELAAWQRVQSQYAKGTEWRKQADEQVASLQKQLIEERKQAEAEAYQQSMNWLAHKKATSEVSANDELAILEKLQARYKAGSEERMKLDELVYAAKKAKMQESFSLSEGWISHQKAMGQLSLQEELAAWERVQQRYLAGTEQRKKADEQVYTLKQQLIEKEKDAMSKLASTQSSSLEKLKNDAIKRINDERDAFVAAQDAKIKAIDDLLAKEQESNEDDDYDAELAKKMARLTVLEAGVGIDAERERKQLIEDIDKMKLDRERVLRKRDLEAQKTQLQDEKELKEDGYKDQVSQLESHYDDLLDAFKSFSDDTVSQADALKQLQILKESEKNETILSNLDTFIASYQSKMASINQLSGSSKDADLAEYNNNKDLWDKAKASGNTAEMARLSERNQQIRDQYGIKSDTGKLQAFKDGGVVKGKPGAAVPVIAHAGEMYLNQGQQGNLFKLLDFAMPKISVPAYNFSSPQNTIINNYQFDNSIGSVALEGTNAVAGLYDQRGGLIERQRTIGERVR